MGRGCPVHSRHRAVLYWTLHDRLPFNAPRSVPVKRTFEFLKEFGLAHVIPTIPLDSYHLCLSYAERALTIFQISLAFWFGKRIVTLPSHPLLLNLLLSVPVDIVVLVLVAVLTRTIKSGNRGVNIPCVLDAVNRDTEIYFAVISLSHFSVVVMYSAARVRFILPVLEFGTC